MANELTRYEVMPLTLDETFRLGDVFAKSGFFQDSRGAAQAVVKILAGRELGFGPLAAMAGVYIVKGRVTLSANLIAAAIKRSGRYSYRIQRLDDAACVIEFLENGERAGESSFTMQDATKAGLAGGDNWRKYPRNMLFARALSNGAKWFCPDVFNGPVYTPDELGADVDGETGEVVGVPAAVPPEPEPTEKPATTTGQTWPPRPWDAETLRRAMQRRAVEYGDGQPDERQLVRTRASLNNLTNGDNDRRRAVTAYLFGKPSSKDLAAGECTALARWIAVRQQPDGKWVPDAVAVQEAAAVVRAWQVEQGQQEMALEGAR